MALCVYASCPHCKPTYTHFSGPLLRVHVGSVPARLGFSMKTTIAMKETVFVYRSMNENLRLADIVEAVKILERAITKDSGVPSTFTHPQIVLGGVLD